MPPSYPTFVLATLILALIPGPNVTAVIGTSLSHGVGRGLLMASGASLALAIQIVVVVAGLAPLLNSAVWIGEVLRWAGVAYLLYLAVKEWRSARPGSLMVTAAPRSARIFGRGMLIATVNPKTIAFLAAFLPQFVDTSRPVLSQFLVLGATFLAVLFSIDAAYALLSGQLRGIFTTPRAALYRGRFAAACLVGTASWLALSRR
ncbi:MAG: LysE family translocator [Hyphomicrobiales bacterium]